MKVVLDTGFISSLFKINRLDLLKKFFDVKTVSIPNAVLVELSKARFFKDLLLKITPDQDSIDGERWITVEDSNALDGQDLGMGEREAIALALNTAAILLIDDQPAKERAVKIGIEAFDLTMFLHACKKKGLISQQEMKNIIRDLKEKDYYEFKNSIQNDLLNY